MFRKLRAFLFTGIVVSLPAFITVYLLYFSFRILDSFTNQWTARLIGHAIPGLGLIVMLLLLTAIGAFTTRLVGKRLLAGGERVFETVPLVRGLYSTVKKLVNVFIAKEGSGFRRMAVIEYPRKGVYSLAFVTGETDGTLLGRQEDLINLFIPTTPNPTSGVFLIVPRDQVQFLDISVQQGLSMIISAGAVQSSREAGYNDEAGGLRNGEDG